MAGFVQIAASGAPVSNFRITEVESAGDADNVAITNLGNAAGNLGQYRVSVIAGAPLLLALTDIVVAPGGRVTLHLNQTGTNTQTDLYFPGVSLGNPTGSVGLYAPNTVNTALTIADQMIDFVQWGAVSQLNEDTAAAAGLWTAGTFVPAVAAGHSVQFCGSGSQHGASFWQGLPTPGSPDCLTPVSTGTWGRLKTLYR
jgi:hypothetical protein